VAYGRPFQLGSLRKGQAQVTAQLSRAPGTVRCRGWIVGRRGRGVEDARWIFRELRRGTGGRRGKLNRSFHLRWKQVPDPTHHSRKWAFSLLDTGFRHGPRGPTHESNHKADRFANVRVLATWTLFESEFWPNRFKRLGIRPIQSENFRLRLSHAWRARASQRSPERRAWTVQARSMKLAALSARHALECEPPSPAHTSS